MWTMSEVLVTSPVNYKDKTKHAYLRVKNFSPKFKVLLRQRYQERVEKSRSRLLDRYRNIGNENDTTCKRIIEECQGLHESYNKDLVTPVLQNSEDFNIDEELLFEEVFQEELSQFENWLLQEYEAKWDEEENSEVTVICPLCCRGYFECSIVHSDTIYCTKCKASFITRRTMLEIQDDIFSEVNNHNLHCSADPSFVMVPRDKNLFNLCIACDVCSLLEIII